jgi:hypothetical protein
MLNCGDTFLIEDEDGLDRHLWIVVTPPTEGEVIIVSVTTQRKKSEALVVLRKGDHPFISHDSVVAYAYSGIRAVDDIELAIENCTATRREPVPEAILKKVRVGLRDSDFTPNGVRHYYRAVMNE